MSLVYNVKKKTYHNVEKGILAGYESGLQETISLLETTSKAYAPVRTGVLRSSIFSKIKKYIGRVVSPASYSIYQENSANGGRGYMKPAADFVKTRITAIFGKHIRNGIRRN